MSGRKNVLISTVLAAAQSTATSFTTPSINISFLDNIALQLDLTGTAVGSIFVEGSINGLVYQPLTLSPNPAATGSAQGILINLSQLAFTLLRVRFVASTGTGTMTVTASGKEI